MKNVLLPAHRPILKEFARANVLLGFDFDGTLAPIVPDPERAEMRPTTSRLLEDLSRSCPCIVISGRARADVLRRLPKNLPMTVAGNHGVESGELSRRLLDRVVRWRAILEAGLAGHPGVRIEEKGCSLSVHYRHSRNRKNARAAILDAVRSLRDVRVIGGLHVVNILPKGSPHKGTALRRECARLECDTAVFVGDDETDEDVFALDPPPRLLGVRVGALSASAAPYFLPGQARIDELLKILIRLRGDTRAGSGAGSP